MVILLIGVYYYYTKNNQADPLTNNATTQNVVKNNYTNKKYKYSLSYSNDFKITTTEEEERLPADESSSILLSSEKTNSHLIIKTKDTTSGFNLVNYANSSKNNEISDKNSNFPNKIVSSVSEVEINKTKAYTYGVDNYTDSFGHNDYKVTFIQNGNIVLEIKSDTNNSVVDEIISSIHSLPNLSTNADDKNFEKITFCGNILKVDKTKLNNAITKKIIEVSNSNTKYTKNICDNHKYHAPTDALDIMLLDQGDVRFESIIYKIKNNQVYGESGFDGSLYGPIGK